MSAQRLQDVHLSDELDIVPVEVSLAQHRCGVRRFGTALLGRINSRITLLGATTAGGTLMQHARAPCPHQPCSRTTGRSGCS